MQAQNDDQRSTESDTDGRRNAEQSPIQDQTGVAFPQAADMGNRTVCMSANLSGKGGAAA